jgi:hypothetical protein
MSFRRAAILAALSLGVLLAFQRPFREYPGIEYSNFPLPSDYQDKAEWTFARLMYPPAFGRGRGFRRFAFSDWREGVSSWTTDYPRSDRHFAQAVRRLTRLSARSVEQPVNVEEGDQYNWPFLYAVEVGHWNPDENHAAAIREFLLRGGFLMVDDFHGSVEWSIFEQGMKRIFPDRPIVEIEDKDPIFHTIYDLDSRYQVPGAQYLRSGRLYEQDGVVPHWRGIYDDRGRLMVAICFDMDLGDSWEWADVPQYPERFSALGIRIGVNYVMYSMTH